MFSAFRGGFVAAFLAIGWFAGMYMGLPMVPVARTPLLPALLAGGCLTLPRVLTIGERAFSFLPSRRTTVWPNNASSDQFDSEFTCAFIVRTACRHNSAQRVVACHSHPAWQHAATQLPFPQLSQRTQSPLLSSSQVCPHVKQSTMAANGQKVTAPQKARTVAVQQNGVSCVVWSQQFEAG